MPPAKSSKAKPGKGKAVKAKPGKAKAKAKAARADSSDDDAADGLASAADAAISRRGARGIKTLSEADHVRFKASDTGSKEVASAEGHFVVVEKGEWRLAYGVARDRSEALCTVMREGAVNTTDIALADGGLKHVDISADGLCVAIEDNGPGVPAGRNRDGHLGVTACFGMFRTGTHTKRSPNSLSGGTHGKGMKLVNCLATRLLVVSTDRREVADGCGRTVAQEWRGFEHPRAAKERASKKRERGTRVEFEIDPQWWPAPKRTLERLVREYAPTLATATAITLGRRPASRVRLNGDACPFTNVAKLVRSARDCDPDRVVVAAPTLAWPGFDPPLKWEVVFEVRAPARAATSLHAEMGTPRPRDARWSVVNGTPTFAGTNFAAILAPVVAAVLKLLAKDPEWKAVGALPTAVKIRNCVAVYACCLVPGAEWNEQVKTSLASPRDSKLKLTFPAAKLKAVATLVAEVLRPSEAGGRDTKETREKLAARLGDREKFQEARLVTVERRKRKPKTVPGARVWIVEGDSASRLVERLLKSQSPNRDPQFSPATDSIYNLGGVINNVAKGLVKTADGGVAISAKLRADAKIRGLMTIMEEQIHGGGYVIATDVDIDGSYICTLVIELARHLDPAALAAGRVQMFATPYARWFPPGSKRDPVEFASAVAKARACAKRTFVGGTWGFYKGLGALDKTKDYLLVRNLAARLHPIHPRGDPRFAAIIRTYLNADNVFARRIALSGPPPDAEHASIAAALAQPAGAIPAADFVGGSMYEFASESLIRHHVALSDGLTESWRKIIFGVGKLSRTKALAVVQAAGVVSGASNYLHGDKSLCDTLMACGGVYIGSPHTVPFVRLDGSGPTRKKGAADAAAPRYVHMKPNAALLGAMFVSADMPFLERVDNDGTLWEPRRYAPVLPLAAMVTKTGIAYGWVQTTFARDPLAVCDTIAAMVRAGGEAPACPAPLPPATRGYRGRVMQNTELFDVDVNPAEDAALVTRAAAEFAAFDAAPAKSRPRKPATPTAEVSLRVDWTTGSATYDPKTGIATLDEIPVFDAKGPVTIAGWLKKFHERAAAAGWDVDDSRCGQDFVQLRVAMPPADWAALGDNPARALGLAAGHVPKFLNMLDDRNRVRWLPSYEAIIEAWFTPRRALYGRRVRREQALAAAELVVVEGRDRFCTEREQLGLRNRMPVPKMEKILARADFPRVDSKRLTQERGENGTALKPADLTAAIFEGPGANFDYLLDMTARQQDDVHAVKRAEAAEKWRARVARLKADRKPFRGAQAWLDDVAAMRALIEEGYATVWKFEDFNAADEEAARLEREALGMADAPRGKKKRAKKPAAKKPKK
jgi:DNA gyrase/topoisomerase IV subunit B